MSPWRPSLGPNGPLLSARLTGILGADDSRVCNRLQVCPAAGSRRRLPCPASRRVVGARRKSSPGRSCNSLIVEFFWLRRAAVRFATRRGGQRCRCCGGAGRERSALRRLVVGNRPDPASEGVVIDRRISLRSQPSGHVHTVLRLCLLNKVMAWLRNCLDFPRRRHCRLPGPDPARFSQGMCRGWRNALKRERPARERARRRRLELSRPRVRCRRLRHVRHIRSQRCVVWVPAEAVIDSGCLRKKGILCNNVGLNSECARFRPEVGDQQDGTACEQGHQ